MNENLLYPKCNVCAAKGVNTTPVTIVNGLPVSNDTGWFTTWGPLPGAKFNLPARTVQRAATAGQPAGTQSMPISPTHYCPACVAALGVDKIEAALTPAGK